MWQLQKLYLVHNQVEDITALSQLLDLKHIYLDKNLVRDIGPLQNMTEIRKLRLMNNRIEDILPLILNENVDSGDLVALENNPLNEKSLSEYIPILIERGVNVFW